MRFLVVRRHWWWLSTLAVLAILASVLAASAGAAPGPATTTDDTAVPQQVPAVPENLKCTLSREPAEPLEMNTVAANRLFKTVAMEKEVFHCSDASGLPGQIRDVETFIEIVQNEKAIVEVRAELATCVKDFISGQIACGFSTLDLGKTEAPLLGCHAGEVSMPADPVVMNTAASGNVIKTIKVEKEVLRCPGGAASQTEIRDVYIFTEIIESLKKLANGQATYRPVTRRFLGVVCIKQEAAATVAGCKTFNPLKDLPVLGVQ